MSFIFTYHHLFKRSRLRLSCSERQDRNLGTVCSWHFIWMKFKLPWYLRSMTFYHHSIAILHTKIILFIVIFWEYINLKQLFILQHTECNTFNFIAGFYLFHFSVFRVSFPRMSRPPWSRVFQTQMPNFWASFPKVCTNSRHLEDLKIKWKKQLIFVLIIVWF